ncbi:MAG: hypothetical protein ABIH38_03010 [Patescibacteria group bacterium]
MAINIEKFGGKLTEILGRFFIYIAIFFAVVVLVIGYLLLIQPKWVEVRETGIFDYNKEVKNKEDAENYLVRLKNSLDKFQAINSSDIDKLEQSLPSEKGVEDLFIIMEEVAASADFNLNSIDIAEGESLAALNQAAVSANLGGAAGTDVKAKENLPVTQNIYALNISLVFSGSSKYDDMKKLLVNLEKELRIMDIKSLSFSPSKSDSAGEISEYNINLITYYFNNQTP